MYSPLYYIFLTSEEENLYSSVKWLKNFNHKVSITDKFHCNWQISCTFYFYFSGVLCGQYKHEKGVSVLLNSCKSCGYVNIVFLLLLCKSCFPLRCMHGVIFTKNLSTTPSWCLFLLLLAAGATYLLLLAGWLLFLSAQFLTLCWLVSVFNGIITIRHTMCGNVSMHNASTTCTCHCLWSFVGPRWYY